MKLVFLGPPGAGKGTQALYISQALAIPHISTGDMLRSAVKKETPTGIQAKAFMDAGKLVPDSVIIDMVRERLSEPDCKNGYLLDGFPRTVEQAEALNQIAMPDAVVNIAVPDEKLLSRLTGRRVCGSCNGTHHISRLADPTKCPACNGELIHRNDDKPETIMQRLSVYHAQTSPLIEYYTKAGLIRTVDGSVTPDEVDTQVRAALGILA